jgi:DNA repair protein RadD
VSIILRPYQERGLAAVRRHYGAGRRSVLLVGPTGMGKGTVAAFVLAGAVSKGRRALFVVHRIEIVKDVAGRIRDAGVERVSVLAGDATAIDPEAQVVVCSVQTLFARGERPSADIIVWDEAHHCVARSYLDVREAYPNARHLGLTATPERSDGTGLGDCFEVLEVCATVAELTALGVLAPCDVIAPSTRQKELAADPVEAYLMHSAGKRAVFFCQTVHHATETASALLAAGVPAGVVDGGTPADEREATLEALRTGSLLAVCNVFCLTEGWDCPPVETVVLARPCGSVATFLQCIGRGLRTSPETGKSRALLLDLCGASHEHGLPDDERVFSLDGAPIKLANKPPPLTTCQECGAVFRPVPACPRCGTLRPKPELPEVRPSRLIRSPAVVTERDKLDVYLSLLEVAEERGYKDGWAGHVFKDRFGYWPPRSWRARRVA